MTASSTPGSDAVHEKTGSAAGGQDEGVGVTEELNWLSAAELSKLYRTGAVSPVEVVEASLTRMAEVNPLINAMVTVTEEQARREAKEAENRLRSGEDLPPLFGVPILVKDLTDTAGVRTTYGSVLFEEHVPEEDAIAWARLKAQGVILLGKTTTPEWGLTGVTESKLTGITGTPWDPSRTSGGSSGGSAAAVTAGIGPIAWGSDGGGSIRVPSSLCGAAGIKPTIGRIPTAHNTDGDSTEGPIARTVLDTAMMFDVTVGPHPLDRFALPHTGENFTSIAAEAGDLTGFRIAATTDLGQKVLDPQVRRLFALALDDMRAAGAVVEEVELELPDTADFFAAFNGYEYANYVDEMAAAGAEVWPLVIELANQGRQKSGQQVNDAFRHVKTAIYEEFLGAMTGFDVLVTPTTPIPAFAHAGDFGPSGLIEGQEVPPWGVFLHAMTEPPSHAGLPAVSVRGGFTDDGLPIGLQFIGHLYQDAAAIAAAARYERATPWAMRRPAL